MADICAGLTVTWGKDAFDEVTSIKVDATRGLPVARDAVWSLDLGTITIECLGSANVSPAMYGRRDVLAIEGDETGKAGTGGITWYGDCIYQSYQATGKVNDVARYVVTFKILDTVNAPDPS